MILYFVIKYAHFVFLECSPHWTFARLATNHFILNTHEYRCVTCTVFHMCMAFNIEQHNFSSIYHNILQPTSSLPTTNRSKELRNRVMCGSRGQYAFEKILRAEILGTRLCCTGLRSGRWRRRISNAWLSGNVNCYAPYMEPVTVEKKS